MRRRTTAKTGRISSIAATLAMVLVLIGTILPRTPASAQTPRDIASGRVIVTLASDADPSAVADRAIRQGNAEVRQVYRSAIRGFAATLSPAAAEALARDPSVQSITPDYPVHATAQTLPTGVDRIDADKNATAAIDGVDTRVNVDIAIIDSGIAAHPDLNVVGGTDCTKTGSYADDNGHGTHVAGTAAAKDNSFGVVGVAPGARLYAVKSLNSAGDGDYSTLICGVDWITQNAGTIDVANMSLAGNVNRSTCDTDPFHKAICNSVAAGVTYTVAAGNASADASNFVPASFDEVITVSAVDDRDGTPANDSFASFSNYGAVVDIAAPGVNILSTLYTGGYGTKSGTSMASPHVAGAAGLVIASRGRIGPAAVMSALQSMKQNIALPGDPDSINEGVLYVGGSFQPQPTPAPTSPPTTNGNLPIVSAFRSAGSTSPTYAYDNNTATSWYTSTTSTPTSAYVTFDLGQVRSISSLQYQFRLAGYADRFYVQFSSDGTRYATLAVLGNPPAQQTQTLNVSTSARYVRFYFVNPNNDPRLGFLAEVDIFGAGGTTSPTPTPAPTSPPTPTPAPTSPPTANGNLPIVSAVRSAGSTSPIYAYDNNTATSWYTSTTSTPTSAYITFDLGQVRSISSLQYQFRLAGYADRFYVQFSSDGTRYATLAVLGNPPAQQTQTLNISTSARYVRFYFVNPNNDPRLGFLAEVDIFGSSAAGASVSEAESTPAGTPVAEEERSLRERATGTPAPEESSATPTGSARRRSTATSTPAASPTEQATTEANRTLRGRETGTPVTTPTPATTATPVVTTTPTAASTTPAPGTNTATVVNTRGAGANCRVGPSSDAAVITVVPEGSLMTLNGDRQGDWQPVICEGQAGFISASLMDSGTTEPSRGLRGADPTAGATRPVDEGAGQPWLPMTPGADGTAELVEAASTATAPPATVPPTPTPAGPAPFAIVASSWTGNSIPATAAYDNNLETAWQTTTGVPEGEAAAIFDLGEFKPIGSVRWLLATQGTADGLSIQVSEDAERWMTVAQPRNIPIGEWQTTQVNVAARYIRFLFENPTNASSLGGLVEVEALPALGVVQPVIPDPITPTPTPATIRSAEDAAPADPDANATIAAPAAAPTSNDPAAGPTAAGLR